MNYKVVLCRPDLGIDWIISESCQREFIAKCIRKYERSTVGPDKGRVTFNGEADNYSISWKKFVTSFKIKQISEHIPQNEIHIKFIPIT